MTVETTPTRRNRRRAVLLIRHDDLIDVPVPGGVRDGWSIDAILGLLPELPNWARWKVARRSLCRQGVRTILEWLAEQPGEGWQDRWMVSGADTDAEMTWLVPLMRAERAASTEHDALCVGMTTLLLCRIVFPSYTFLARYSPSGLYRDIRTVCRPDLFEAMDAHGRQLGADNVQRRNALNAVCKMVLRIGRDVDQLTADDLLGYRAWHHHRHGKVQSGLNLAWTLLREVADLGEHATLMDAVRFGQSSTTEIVDSFDVRSTNVRAVLIRYLDERRPGLDYSSLTNLAGRLVGSFWCDIEDHHPGIDTLHLPDDVVEQWKHRLKSAPVKNRNTARCFENYVGILTTVRAFYLDIHELAVDDPTWARWSVPCPVRKRDLAGFEKARRKTIAAMHQRVRERLPHLPVLVGVAERFKAEQAALTATAKPVLAGSTFDHDGRRYRRVLPDSYRFAHHRSDAPPLLIEDLATGDVVNVDQTEREAFWSWAAIETLRLTGVRIEELLEISHLGLISYQLPKTGEIVPMLQIVPSKGNEERLLLVSPELASVLATIITRLRSENGGAVPLTARYDPHERLTGPRLPHLFQMKRGAHWQVLSSTTIRKRIGEAIARTGVTDSAGRPLHLTAHDFRRIFATEAVTGGLPIHIVAKILGHKDLNMVQVYAAVFDEELVRAYRLFVDRRRALRSDDEYREPTEQEWNDFQQHFEQRKLELGTCGRPYGTPCQHEHACIRCPSLRVDPRARDKLVEITANLRDRIAEARANGWTGEVEGLQVSLNAAAIKLASTDRMLTRKTDTAPTDLGIPARICAVTTGISSDEGDRQSTPNDRRLESGR